MSVGRDFIGPFQLLRLIRSGTTTQVWEALRSGDKERIALKLLLKDFRKDKYEIGQLKHEALVGSTLDHPNVIKIFGYHDDQGYPLLAMQLFNARNLKIEMRESPEFIQPNISPIIRSCAMGLEHMHNQGWIHCDVKPDNFLADDEAHVKLIDFSIALKQKRVDCPHCWAEAKRKPYEAHAAIWRRNRFAKSIRRRARTCMGWAAWCLSYWLASHHSLRILLTSCCKNISRRRCHLWKPAAMLPKILLRLSKRC